MDLLEEYLPLHNPQLLSKKVYNTVLLSYVDKNDFKALFERLKHWPLCYDAKLIVQIIQNTMLVDSENEKTALKYGNLVDLILESK